MSWEGEEKEKGGGRTRGRESRRREPRRIKNKNYFNPLSHTYSTHQNFPFLPITLLIQSKGIRL